MAIRTYRRTAHPLRILGSLMLLLIVVVIAVLIYGWCRPAGDWHVEAPGPVQNAPVLAGGQQYGVATALRGPGGGATFRPDPSPAPGA